MKNYEKRSTTTTTRFEAGVMITVALLVLLLLAVLILPGCVAQEYEYCPPRLVIITDQDAGLYGEPAETRAQSRARYVDEWFDCIDSIHVYIFDENERFVTIWSGGGYTPGQEYEVPYDKLGLPEGVYSFVAWTNRWGDHTCNVNELLAQGGDFYLDDLNMYLDTHGGEIDHDLNHRHWGILERANMSNQSVISPSEYRIVVDPAIHRVNFMLEGVEVDRPGQTRVDAEDYSVTVSDNNPVHNFRNKYVTGQPTYYHTRTMMDVTGAPGGPGAWFDDEGIPPAGADYKDGVALLTASMNLVHIHDLSKTGFSMHNNDSGEEVFAYDDIVGLINLVYSSNDQKVDFEETLEFDILVSFVAPFYVNITINGWTYRLNLVDLGRK